MDVVVSHVEVNGLHGTGVFTQALFSGEPDVVSVRSHDAYDARQTFGAFSLRLPQPDPRPAVVAARVRAALPGLAIRRIAVIPFFADDVRNALALADLSAAPLCTFVMDDRNVFQSDIPDELVAELLARSSLRLAVSEELRDSYQRKFGVPFAFVPPLVDPALVLRQPSSPDPEALAGRRAVMVGNVWGQEWLALLCQAMEGSELELEWYSATGLRWHRLGPEELARSGIRLRPGLSDAELVSRLRHAAFAVLPSGTLAAGDDHQAIARFSLPSKLVYSLATAHLPTLVLGHPDTAAARFVLRRGLGLRAPYERAALDAAVAELLRPEVQLAVRARAAALAPVLSAEGAGSWVWRSLELGRPIDDRWERLGSSATAGTAS
ncbi:MAG TPA: hypothetical protein VFG59_06140 [Anaeromyxobacter sp.]|nr:hypothetical protein [Anaeromyxobacter sp.]